MHVLLLPLPMIQSMALMVTYSLLHTQMCRNPKLFVVTSESLPTVMP